MSAPELILHLWVPSQYLFRRDTLYGCYYLRWRLYRNTLYQKMYMILIRSYFNKIYLVPLTNTGTRLLQCLLYQCRKYLPTVLHRAHYMI